MTIRHLVILIAVALSGCSKQDPATSPNSARRLPVEVLTAKRVDSYSRTRTYAGTVEARQTSVLAFQRVGRLVELLVDEGEKVTADQVLARLDVGELKQQSLQIEASRTQAMARLAELKAGPRQQTIDATKSTLADVAAQLDLAKTTFNRVALLQKRGGSTRQQYDDAKSAVTSIRARRDAAQKQLDELLAGTRNEQIDAQTAVVSQLDAQIAAIAIRINDSSIRAPFDGTVTRRRIDTGATVAPGQEILTVIESGQLEARIGLPARVARSLDPTTTYSFLCRDTIASGRFKATLPQVERTTRNQIVVFDIEPSGGSTPIAGDIIRLQHNQTVQSPGFWLPLPALTKGTRGLWSAFVVSPPDAPNPNTINLATVEVIYTNGERVFVRGTLEDGDQVIASGSHRIVRGQLVDPVSRPTR